MVQHPFWQQKHHKEFVRQYNTRRPCTVQKIHQISILQRFSHHSQTAKTKTLEKSDQAEIIKWRSAGQLCSIAGQRPDRGYPQSTTNNAPPRKNEYRTTRVARNHETQHWPKHNPDLFIIRKSFRDRFQTEWHRTGEKRIWCEQRGHSRCRVGHWHPGDNRLPPRTD